MTEEARTEIGADIGDASPAAGDSQRETDNGLQEGERQVGDEDEPELGTIRFSAPYAVRAAFDEVRDLYSAVTGGPADLKGFVEVLIAESQGGPVPPLLPDWAGRRPAPATREELLARASDSWKWLRGLSDDTSLLGEARAALTEVDRLSAFVTEAGSDADARIRALLSLADDVDRQLGEVLARMGESGAWRALQFASAAHYAEERLGISRSSAEDRARLARSLRNKPIVRKAYEEGQIGSESATLVLVALGRAQIEESLEQIWVDHAACTSVKRLRDEIRLLLRNGALSRVRAVAAAPDDQAWYSSLARVPGRSMERLTRCAAEAAASARDLEPSLCGFRSTSRRI